MKLTCAMTFAALASLATLTTASADTGTPGRKGTIAGYTPGGGSVIASKACARKSRTWNYVTCGKIVRARVKARLCASKGKGSHRYLYRIGNGRKTKSSVYCKTGKVSTLPRTGRPGRKGTIAAYAPTRHDLLTSKACRKTRSTWDYVGCGKLVRARVKAHLCSTRGKGSHKYHYQLAANKKTKSSVYCK